MDTITGELPERFTPEVRALPFIRLFIRGLCSSDPNFDQPGRIDLLIGADCWGPLAKASVLFSADKQLHAFDSALGWVVGGMCQFTPQQARTHLCLRSTSTDQGMDRLLRAFWEVKEPPSDMGQLSAEDYQALEQFNDTHMRNSDGRYEVTLPRKKPTRELGCSRPTPPDVSFRMRTPSPRRDRSTNSTGCSRVCHS